jgi:chitinase
VDDDLDALAEANEAAADLLRLYEALGVTALIVTLEDSAIYVRCQSAEDVEPLCRRVLKEHEAPEGRVLN